MTDPALDLPAILAGHMKWLRSEAGGSRANLSRANLSGANLCGANLYGANLSRANLYGKKIAKGSKVAFAGPVGNADRVVHGVIVEPDADHKKPWLFLFCGCFQGDRAAYLARIKDRYSEERAYLAQCKAALVLCEAIAKTWTIEVTKVAK